jgi:hypothetical protein
MSDKDLRKIRRCPDRELRALLLDAVRQGFRYRITRSGAMFYGDNGQSVAVHFSQSDHRAYMNSVTQFKRIGYTPDRKGQ